MGFKPPALRNRPDLALHQGYFYTVYQRLASRRTISMAGPSPIQVSEILAYCELFKIDPVHERAQLYRYVAGMDDAYLEHRAAKQKASGSK